MLLRSFSFRLAATYALLFSLSLAALLATYHWVSITGPREKVKDALRVESEALERASRGDTRALARALERRAGAPAPRAAFHLLSDPQGRTISTNLPSWPRFDGERWVSIEADVYRDGDEDDHEALALDRKLADGSRLLVGRDVEELDDLEEAITSAGRYLIAATILLALLGAMLMNRAIGRRIASVTTAARQVIGGDLAGRVALSGSGDDFDRLAATLNTMLDQVEAGVEAVRRVSDNVAHELRTPLARLQAHLREIGAGPGSSLALAAAAEEADRLQAIFDAILRISRIESGRHDVQLVAVDISELLGDVADLYGAAAEEKNIRLSCDSASSLSVAGDRDLLFQALSNLLDNAIKFTPENGRVSLFGVRSQGRITIRVADTGPGVSEELRPHLGERFFRGHSSNAVPGFGLGLSLVEAVARLHGSAIAYRDNDPGLLVEWTLPVG